MAFPHEFEAVPLLRYVFVHFYMLWKARKTGLDYGVLFWRYVLERMEKFRNDGCFALYLGAQPSLIIFRADHFEKVLTSNTNISKGHVYRFIQPWLGLGLLTSTGSKWKHRRRLLTPAFHFRILDEFAVIMNQQAKVFVQRMEVKEPRENIVPYVTAVTLDIVCETIMGVRMNSQTTGSGKNYLQSLKATGTRLLERILSPMQWVDCVYYLTQAGRNNARDLQELHNFTMKVINDRKTELAANPEELDKMADYEESMFRSRKPFLDMLLVEHMRRKTMSVSDIREEVDTFMFEGHDTTSTGIVWTIYLIGLHPEVQTKIQKEIDDIFQGNTDTDVTAEHIKHMKYLETVLKESQRIYPPVPRISRTVTEEFWINGKPVPVGTERDHEIASGSVLLFWKRKSFSYGF
ncbi:cytochrome P450 4c3-like [Tropilaelaps mercedesae]|uniref:Cytochrome P450 4c3-like n=1 Tax=Tropilaelaps mercedesae TaxID=418985 RepID=A0A1V9Y1S7_9ACAR|nr:cytochrome P450 4c3-like [Tropilaelaps mercedesae]